MGLEEAVTTYGSKVKEGTQEWPWRVQKGKNKRNMDWKWRPKFSAAELLNKRWKRRERKEERNNENITHISTHHTRHINTSACCTIARTFESKSSSSSGFYPFKLQRFFRGFQSQSHTRIVSLKEAEEYWNKVSALLYIYIREAVCPPLE